MGCACGPKKTKKAPDPKCAPKKDSKRTKPEK